MSLKEKFIWGFCGSVAVEIITLYQVYHTSEMTIPERYHRKGFWIVRFLLSIIAGGLAVAYDIDKPVLAVNIGASAPLIFQALAQGYKEK
jgi:CBS-domain-containing membrane protein